VKVVATAVPTRNEFEDLVHDLILSGGFTDPDVNMPLHIDGRRVVPDFRWPEQRVVVEADSRQWHDNPVARAEDAERRGLLEAAGETVVSVTYEQAVARPEETLARLSEVAAPRSASYELRRLSRPNS
jgi:very-short-patch-repair endonuclease